MKITNCSIGCMFAEGAIAECQCQCAGVTHGLLANRPVSAKCTPAAEMRCKSGEEKGECKCACEGINHALYRNIAEFEHIHITGMVAQTA